MITQQDEQRHAATAHPLWRESYYFNFYDSVHHLGGATTIALHPNRAREKRKEGLFYLYMPEGQVLVHLSTVPAEDRDPVQQQNGLEYEILEPLQRWRIRAEGTFQWVASGQQLRMAQPPTVSQGSERVSLELMFEAVSPPYDYSSPLIFRNSRHYEQYGRVRGRVRVGDGSPTAINGLGCRDHSWGLRDWGIAEYYHMAMAQFAEDFNLTALQVGLADVQVAAGFVCQADRNMNVEAVEVQVQHDTSGRVPQQTKMRVIAEGNLHLSLRSSLITWVDVRLVADEEKATYLTESLVQFISVNEDTGREWKGYGFQEYLRQDPASR